MRTRKSGKAAGLEIGGRAAAEENGGSGEHLRSLRFLSKTAMEFVEFPQEGDIYLHIAERLGELTGDAIVCVNSFSHEEKCTRLRAIAGLGGNAKKLDRLLGKKLPEMKFVADEEAIRGMTGGRLEKIEGGIYRLMFGQVPKAACGAIERLFNIGDIYAMGLRRKGRLLGNAAIIMRRGKSLADREATETFINQAAVALERKTIEDALLKARDELENKVRERTAELAKANEGLKSLDREKDEFFNIVSHELVTPLVPIRGYADILNEEKGGTLTPKQREAIAIITESSERLGRLINDVLDFSRINSGRLRLDKGEMSVCKAIESAVMEMDPFACKKKVALVARECGGMPNITADNTRVVQVLGNLIKNAVKFTPCGGKAEVLAERRGNDIVVAVSDTGIGIAENDMHRLFTKFYQADRSAKRPAEGLGLGLAISKGIVEAHGGNIWAESRPGKGSAFYFSLPLGAKT
ncbi:MAG: HAMP domain-containing sensor histidine kinase [Candidatus Diapherotrites archaeon]